MFWLHLGVWPGNLGNFYIFLVCPCRSLLVPLCPISSFHLSYLLVGTLDLPLILCQCLRVPAAGNCSYGSCLWRKCSGRVQVTGNLSSSHLHYKADLQGSSPQLPSFLFYVREKSTIHHAVQWPKERWTSFPCCQVAQCFLGSVTTQIPLWRRLGHVALLLAAPHKPLLLLKLGAVKIRAIERTVCFKYQNPEKYPQGFGRCYSGRCRCIHWFRKWGCAMARAFSGFDGDLDVVMLLQCVIL